METPSVISAAVSRQPRAFRTVGWILVLIAVAFYGVLLARNMGAYAGGSDSSGYLNTARLFREHRVLVQQRVIENLPAEKLSAYAYIPLGFRPMDKGRMVPTYPIGLPLLIVAISGVSGWDAAAGVTMWFHAMAGLGLMFFLGRQTGLTVPWAGLATLLLAASPLYLFMSVQPMSDLPALVWTMAAIVCAWRSRQTSTWSLAAGAAFASAVLIRPTDAIALVPLAIVLGRSWKRWLGFAGGGLPGAIVLGAYNRAAYGGIFASGYGDVSSAFSREFLAGTLAHYGHWLPLLLTPLIIAALGLPSLIQTVPRWVAALSGWAGGWFGLYAFYYCTHETWWYLRFVLPAFPPLIVAALLVLQSAISRWNNRERFLTWIVASSLGIFVVAWSHMWSLRLNVLGVRHDESVYLESAQWAREKLPADAVVFVQQASGSLLYYTDFSVVRWDQISAAEVVEVQRAAAAAGRPLYAMLFRNEEEDQNAFGRIQPGPWEKIGAVRQVNFWKLTTRFPSTPQR